MDYRLVFSVFAPTFHRNNLPPFSGFKKLVPSDADLHVISSTMTSPLQIETLFL
jgi:hypothetical protein